MAKVTMTKGKFNGINACADQNGVIAAAAMDQRGSLQKSIAKARGANGTATDEDMVKFKNAVTQVLTRYASAILLDPEYGLEALKVPGAQHRGAAGVRKDRLRRDHQGSHARPALRVERAAVGRSRRGCDQAAAVLQSRR